MVKRVVQRYLVGAAAFTVALLWTGLGLTSGFECLIVFALASAGTALAQQRRQVATRGARDRRERQHRSETRRRAPRAVLFEDGDSGEWPQAVERW